MEYSSSSSFSTGSGLLRLAMLLLCPLCLCFRALCIGLRFGGAALASLYFLLFTLSPPDKYFNSFMLPEIEIAF